ncbi:MAG: hypothetical protein OXM62_02810 [bacterium]|nr:hypothetical protein [bacterium]
MPRRIIKSKSFSYCPKHHDALAQIEQIIHKGGDITPYLSKNIKKVNYNDAMLNDWGIHHLHLGARIERDGFVERTDMLLYCRFEKGHAYFVAVLPHGSWAKQELVKTIHENWPALIDRYRVRGVVGDRVTDEEIKDLRKVNVNLFVEIENGVAYLPIGGGAVSSGENVLDVRRADMCLHWADRMQEKIIDDFPDIKKRARDRGILFSDPAVFQMRIWQESFWMVEINSAYGILLGTP